MAGRSKAKRRGSMGRNDYRHANEPGRAARVAVRSANATFAGARKRLALIYPGECRA